MPTISETTRTPAEDATTAIQLTQQVKAGGCASKLPPGMLTQVLSGLKQQQDENVLVGFATCDDAGVYRLNAEQALVQTVDFFTPMVDDPFTYGRIAATNALSDVYAMGGRALTALALVCFPQDGNLDVLGKILAGGLDVMQNASCTVIGGHSVRDNEMKFGYAVTGIMHPDRVLTNSRAQVGDRLVLTKAIGTGVITTALKQRRARDEWIDGAVASMTHSNRIASEIVTRPEFQVHAMTDITGFGLVGHAREMAMGSRVRLSIKTEAVPLLEGSLPAAELGCIPGGLIANREFAECFSMDAPDAKIPDLLRTLLYDPQTSGGLLISVRDSDAANLTKSLRDEGYPAAIIGSVVEGSPRIVLH